MAAFLLVCLGIGVLVLAAGAAAYEKKTPFLVAGHRRQTVSPGAVAGLLLGGMFLVLLGLAGCSADPQADAPKPAAEDAAWRGKSR